MNKEYGMMIVLAFIGALIYQIVFDFLHKKKFDLEMLFFIIISIFVSILSLINYPLAPNPSSKYFLDGFYSFSLSKFETIAIFLSIFLQLAALLIFRKMLYEKKLLLVYVFSALYSQLLYFYYVWGGGHTHFFALLTVYILPLFVFISAFEYKKFRFLSIIGNVIIIILFITVLKLAVSFFAQKMNSDQNFIDHVAYKWDTERTKGMITTVDPMFFIDSVEKIKQYSATNKAFFISKYDNVLSILAKKYSGTQYFELRSFIVTTREYNLVKQQLLKANVIFVDNDIDRSFDSEFDELILWNLLPAMYFEHKYQRIPKLKILKKLYKDVISNNYELVDKGLLISVYKRK